MSSCLVGKYTHQQIGTVQEERHMPDCVNSEDRAGFQLMEEMVVKARTPQSYTDLVELGLEEMGEFNTRSS
jgi:hypothetical protein